MLFLAGSALCGSAQTIDQLILFRAVQGLGGGIGIALEYGVVAVVGVEHATRLIRDGQRIRVDGSNGYVELLN